MSEVSKRKRPRADVRAFVMLLALAAVPGVAQGEKKAGAPPDNPPVVGTGTPAIPDAYKLNMLIRTTLIDPKLVRPPDFTPNGLLRLSGFVPTKPQQVNFEMLFQNVAGRWRLFGIAVNTTLAKAATVTPAKDQAQKK